MKKILLLLLTLGLGFTLIGCDVIKKDEPKKDDEIEDVEKPEEDEREEETPPILEDEIEDIEKPDDEIEKTEFKLVGNFNNRLTGNKFTLDNTEGYTKIKIYGTTTNTSTNKDGDVIPARTNIFISNIKFDGVVFDLQLPTTEDKNWYDGKTHTIGNLEFTDYQIRENYNGIGVRVPHINSHTDSNILINIEDINDIEFDLFSTAYGGIDPDIITIYIELIK